MKVYIPKVVSNWEGSFNSLICLIKFLKETRSMIYTINQIEGLIKKLKRRLKIIKILPSEKS